MKIKLISIFIILSFFSCSSKVEDGLDDHGIIVYTEGRVEHFKDNQWDKAVIGDNITLLESIRTGEDGYCEIQFAGKSLVKILEDSSVTFTELSTNENRLSLEAHLDEGSILAKLKKLANMEKFRIKTDQVVAGVRGTEFFVSTNSKVSKIIVEEGSVEIIPNKPEVIKVRDRAENVDPSIRSKVLDTFPVVTVGETVILGEEYIEEFTQDYEELFIEVNRELEKDKPSIEVIDKFVMDTTQSVELVEDKKTVTLPEDVEVFKQIESSELIKEDEDELYQLTLSTKPEGALIYIDNHFVAGNSFSKLYPDTLLMIRVEMKGFETKELEIKPSNLNGEELIIELEEEKTSESIKLNLNIEPKVDRITVNTVEYPTNDLPELQPGTLVTIEISKDGFEDYKEEFILSSSQPIDIILKEKAVVFRGKVSDSDLVVKALTYDDSWVLSNKFGEVISLNSSGKALWKVVTGNSPNNNSYPLAIGNRFIISGINNLSVFNTTDGTEIYNYKLGEGYSHLFGRKVLANENSFIIPGDRTVLIKDSKTFDDIREIDLPELTNSGLALIGNTIYSVDSLGSISEIDIDKGEILYRGDSGVKHMVAASPVPTGDSSLLLVDRLGNVSKFNRSTRSIEFKKDYSNHGGKSFQDPLVSGNRVFISMEDGVVAININSGEEDFFFEGASNLPLIYRDKVFWTSGSLMNISSLIDGTILKSLEVPGTTITPTIIDGRLLVGGRNGEVAILSLSRIMEDI